MCMNVKTRGGGDFLIWPERGRAAEQDMFFRVPRLRVFIVTIQLDRVYVWRFFAGNVEQLRDYIYKLNENKKKKQGLQNERILSE